MENLIKLAKNAKLGDGCFWKHPESVNYNLVFTGTNKSWIDYKAALLGKPTTISRTANSDKVGVYNNSKTLYQVKSDVSPVFAEYKEMCPLDVLSTYTIEDYAMWFLDDGCTIERRDYISRAGDIRYRHLLCIGSLCPEPQQQERFMGIISDHFRHIATRSFGSIAKNNSKATEFNKTWSIPVSIAREIINEAKRFNIKGFDDKLRTRE